MFGKLFVSLALGVSVFDLTLAAPASISPAAIPTSGKYRIRSAVTGALINDPNGDQADGTTIVVVPFDTPRSVDQEWTLDINSANIGMLQSISSFMRLISTLSNPELHPGLGTKEASDFNFIQNTNGILICANPTSFGCLTNPNAPNVTAPITLAPLIGARDQAWIFERVQG